MARTGLTRLPRRLAEHTGKPAPAYRRVWDAAVGGRFPAEFEGNRWSFNDDDLDVIAEAMGLVAAKPATPSSRSVQSASVIT